MTDVAISGGAVVIRGGSVGLGRDCCCGDDACPCPSLIDLCHSVQFTLPTDCAGQATNADFFGGPTNLSALVPCAGTAISLYAICEKKGLRLIGAWAGIIDGCLCTTAEGTHFIDCVIPADPAAEPDWFVGTFTFPLVWGDPVWCAACKPAGSVTWKIAKPPC